MTRTAGRWALAAAAAAVISVGGATGAAAAQDVAPPTLIELCAATSIEQIDALLADVAASDLAGALQPLAALTVPDGANRPVLGADVDLAQIRDVLDCTDTTGTPTSTPTSEPPTSSPAPSNEPAAPTSTPPTVVPDTSSPTTSDPIVIPSLPAETGGGPA